MGKKEVDKGSRNISSINLFITALFLIWEWGFNFNCILMSI